MKVERMLSVGNIKDDVRGIDLTRDLTPAERVSLLKDLRCEMCKVTGDEYPTRLRRVLTVAKRGEG